MIRHLSDISEEKTSHGVGSKRVLLSSSESGCSLTQIAVTTLKKGEVAVAHIHPDMQEGFYVISGELEIILDNKKELCKKDDFVYVPKCTSHEMQALSDVKIMTIGCVIEESTNKFYPILFKQNKKNLIWGSEEWTVSTMPGAESEIENGTWARYRLTEVIQKYPEAILGRQVAMNYNNSMPLLVKIINAQSDLSIQVHPDNDMAQQVHNKLGKSEMWYILDADDDAYLYAGFKKHISKDEYIEKVKDGSIVDVLAKHNVKKGDVFYLPAGRIHAICGGITLAEVQQSSDITYRIFDYNRIGFDGNPRELHTDLALQAIDFNVYPEYKTESINKIDAAQELLNTPYFSIKLVEVTQPIRRNMIKYDSFIILMNIEGDCKIKISSTDYEVDLKKGGTCLIPAAVADYQIIPVTRTKVLEAFINNKKSIKKIISDFLHLK